jgi:hypothetical protein
MVRKTASHTTITLAELKEWEVPYDPSVEKQRQEPPARKRKSCRQPGRYIAGPIPFVWARQAAKINGAAAFIGLLLRHFCDLRKSSTVHVGVKDLRGGADLNGITLPPIYSHRTVQRVLQDLETHGLIQIERRPGRLLTVTVLEVQLSDLAVCEGTGAMFC